VTPLTPEAWRTLLENAGLSDIVTHVRRVNIKGETQGLLKRYGCLGMLRTLGRALRLYLRNPNYRAFVKRVQGQGVVPENITDYFGYGLYVGRKP
jgi:hypothetical protein